MFLTKYRKRRREKRYFRLLEDAFYAIDGLKELQDHDKTSVVVRALNIRLSRLLSHKKVKNVTIGQTKLKPAFNPRAKKFMNCISIEVKCDYDLHYTRTHLEGGDQNKSFNFEDFYDLNQLP